MNNPTQTHSDDQQTCRPGKFDKFIQQVLNDIRGKELAIECENAVIVALTVYYETWEQGNKEAWEKACLENRAEILQQPPELLMRVRQSRESCRLVKQWEEELAMLNTVLSMFVKYNEPV